jgi:hypothetical protein
MLNRPGCRVDFGSAMEPPERKRIDRKMHIRKKSGSSPFKIPPGRRFVNVTTPSRKRDGFSGHT